MESRKRLWGKSAQGMSAPKQNKYRILCHIKYGAGKLNL
jgi:hypothetical protein